MNKRIRCNIKVFYLKSMEDGKSEFFSNNISRCFFFIPTLWAVMRVFPDVCHAITVDALRVPLRIVQLLIICFRQLIRVLFNLAG